MDDYKNGWRYIVWVGGNDDYYKTFSLAQMDYHNWREKGYDQSKKIKNLLREYGFDSLKTINDAFGVGRFTIGRYK